ncbi:uncharacterized protein [Neodiprion pinetum]|uniref:uncharacterized protein n=1 Tax=Neodiprion pinetum TaxID=441929 RepID=UPI00371A3D11
MGANIGTPAGVKWDDVDSAFTSWILTGVITNLGYKNVDAFLDDVQRVVTEKLELILHQEGNVKVILILSCKFENVKHEEISTKVKSFNTSNVAILLPSSDIDGWFTRARGNLLSKVEDFEQRDSGWSMTEILSTAVNINRYHQPLAAGLLTFVELPKDIQRKRAMVNVKNDDERCLLWSITAALHPVNTNTDRTRHYRRYISELECTSAHPRAKKSVIVPIYLSDHLSTANIDTIHLLIVESNPEDDMTGECLCHFNKESSYNAHRRDSVLLNEARTTFAENLNLELTNFKNNDAVPFAVCADLECIIIPEPVDEFETRKTYEIQKPIPHSVAYYVHCSHDETLSEFHGRRGADCIDWFVRRLNDLASQVQDGLDYPVPVELLTQAQRDRHMPAKTCHVCDKKFSKNENKIRDHCHLTDDTEMILFIERAIRGGVAQCSNCYAQANNRFMGEDFYPNKEESYLMYFDVNNLYGAAMSVHLPVGSFEWEYQHVDITNHPDDSSIGYFLEVDLDYPVELHEDHKDLPLCPEHFTPPGMKLTKVQRVLKFEQTPWLEPYITLNTNMRKQSRNEFEKNFYNLMNNAVFGKTMENVRNRTDVRLVTTYDKLGGARTLIARPNFRSWTVFDEDIVIKELDRVKVRFDKPIDVDYLKSMIYPVGNSYWLNLGNSESVDEIESRGIVSVCVSRILDQGLTSSSDELMNRTMLNVGHLVFVDLE